MSNFKRKVNIVESTTPPTNRYDWWYDLKNKALKKPINGNYVSISNGETAGPAEEEETQAGVTYFIGDDIAHMRMYEGERIPYKDFYSRTDITSILVMNGTKSIGNQAFWGCENLKSIKLPNGLVSLESQALYGCTSLKSLHLPNSLEEMRYSLPVDWGCTLSKITGKYTVDNTYVVKDNSLYYTCPFRSFEGGNERLVIPQVETLKSYSVSVVNYEEFEDYDDEGNTMMVYYGADIELPDSLQHIEDNAFGYGCCGIARISGKYSRNGIFVIKDGKLYITAGCQNSDVTDLTIPNDVTVIGEFAVCRHHTVLNIYISDSVKTIQTNGLSMQRECNIYINNTTPPTLEATNAISTYATIYVPSSAVETYKKATNWSARAGQIKGYEFN